MALCCMYTANFVTNRIQKQRVIAFIRLSLRSYIPIPIPGNCFLDKNSISKQNTGKLITNTKGTHYSPQYIWFNKALSLNIIWIFEIPTTKPFHSYRLAFLRYFKFLLETPIKMCIYSQTKPHWQKYNLYLPIIVFSMSC